MTTPVLIVGAGPAGLVLALSLLLNGISVRIIDKEKKHRVGERGAGVMPRSLELHNLLGTIEDILNTGGPPLPIRNYEAPAGIKPIKTFNMSSYVEPTPQCPYSNPILLGQNHHERILRSHLEKFGCHVELGTELRSFEQHDNYVVAHLVREIDGATHSESATAGWLVGTDGAHSVVRKQLGLSFLGETRDADKGVVGDIFVKDGDREFWHFWHLWGSDPSKQMLMFRPSGQDHDVFNFFAFGNELDLEKMSSNRDEFIKAFHAVTGRKDFIFGDLIWSSIYRPNIRMVDKFHDGRVFVAGDAAHCHSPTGGQGLNSSIQDSLNLGWKLALVQRGLASTSLLSSYDQERLPVIAEMLNKTTELLNKTMKNAGNDAAWERGGELHQLGVNYRGSPLIVDEENGTDPDTSKAHAAYNLASATAAQAGDRAPDAPGLVDIDTSEETRFFKIFGASYHTVLIFAGDVEEYRAFLSVLQKLPKGTVESALILPQGSEKPAHADIFRSTLIDKSNFAYSGYFASKGKVGVVVVRPDGVIGARVSSVSGLERYFKGIFM